MTTIYLIRHAEAEGNLYRVAQGQEDSLVTDRGLRQVEALRKRFEGVPIDAVYASDLYRTCVTAGAVYIPRRLPLHRMRALREICVGNWEKRTWGEIARTDAEQMENFARHIDRWHIQDAETPEQVQSRMTAALRQIARENQGKTAAVFSHGCAIRLALAALQGVSLEDYGQTPLGSNTAVSLLTTEDGERWKVEYRDDETHLTPELRRKRGGPRPLDPGLYFVRMDSPEALARLEAYAEENGAAARRLVNGAAANPTFLGVLPDGGVAGILQLNEGREAAEGKGWIQLCHVREPLRKHGYGVQLLGQAVSFYRALGRTSLRTTAAETDARRFCQDYGFVPAGRTADGAEILEKDISFHPIVEF